MFVAAAGFCFFSLSDACPHSHNQITTPGGRYSSEAIFSLLSLFPLLPDVLEAGDRQRERERERVYQFLQSIRLEELMDYVQVCTINVLMFGTSKFILWKQFEAHSKSFRSDQRCSGVTKHVLGPCWSALFFCGCTSSSHWSGTNRPLRGL